ncbi:uncharacterized protein A4U43_C04F25190 [Asparagus officinalis]|uniref:Nuclear transport factor 2 domain-containing protein n=1 Tax=Asparagus officinalis TaxID=4686 RepID=A0A5P1F441_ASPOF|nr:uncharacterized protein LOC109837871 [Asparagus officinalis]ONK72942.1 uncharacterized protein A4U43_C04F25190 [Asparagus officinalis]
MASAVGFYCLPTARLTKKYSRLNKVSNGYNVILASSIHKQIQICLSRGQMTKDWRVQCNKDDSVFELQGPNDSSASMKLVVEFYNLINHKNKNGVLELISDECCYEDLVFYLPFQGKKQIGRFLHELMDAMGPHVKFVVENVTNGRKNSASAIWHLEWRDMKIPFATGYNHFEFHEVGEKLLIGKIRGLEELPLKPGDLVLKLLKTSSTLFDRYPYAAEGLLSNPHDMHDFISIILHMRGHSDPSEQE